MVPGISKHAKNFWGKQTWPHWRSGESAGHGLDVQNGHDKAENGQLFYIAANSTVNTTGNRSAELVQTNIAGHRH
jgi:hypothetical protein